MGADDKKKIRNEKKNPSPPKGRKKLGFKTCAIQPLKAKNVYLDLLKNFRGIRSVENDLRSLGANVVSFFSKDIHYIITSQGVPKDYKDDAEGGSGVQNPAVSTPSPFNLDHGHGVNSPQNESSGASKTQKPALPIRGKRIAEKAKSSQAQGSNNLVTNARTWGVKIVHVDTALAWINKEKEKLPKRVDVASKQEGTKRKLPDRTIKCKTIKEPFIKFESTNKHYRPIYRQLDVWPKLDPNTPAGTCPFDGRSFKCGVRQERAEGEDREEGVCLEDRSSGRDEQPKRGSSRQRGQNDSADLLDSGRVLTGGDTRRRKEAKLKEERKGGFCEVCCIKYDNIDKHVRDDDHQKFARNSKNYSELDKLIIGNGPTLQTFVEDLVARSSTQEEEQMSARSKVSSNVRCSPRNKQSSSLPSISTQSHISPTVPKNQKMALPSRSPAKQKTSKLSNSLGKQPKVSSDKTDLKPTTKAKSPTSQRISKSGKCASSGRKGSRESPRLKRGGLHESLKTVSNNESLRPVSNNESLRPVSYAYESLQTVSNVDIGMRENTAISDDKVEDSEGKESRLTPEKPSDEPETRCECMENGVDSTTDMMEPQVSLSYVMVQDLPEGATPTPVVIQDSSKDGSTVEQVTEVNNNVTETEKDKLELEEDSNNPPVGRRCLEDIPTVKQDIKMKAATDDAVTVISDDKLVSNHGNREESGGTVSVCDVLDVHVILSDKTGMSINRKHTSAKHCEKFSPRRGLRSSVLAADDLVCAGENPSRDSREKGASQDIAPDLNDDRMAENNPHSEKKDLTKWSRCEGQENESETNSLKENVAVDENVSSRVDSRRESVTGQVLPLASPQCNILIDDDGDSVVGVVSPPQHPLRSKQLAGGKSGRIILSTPPPKKSRVVSDDIDGMVEISSPQKHHGPQKHDESSPGLVSRIQCSCATSPGVGLRSRHVVCPSPSIPLGDVSDTAIQLTPRQMETSDSLKQINEGFNVLLGSSPFQKSVLLCAKNVPQVSTSNASPSLDYHIGGKVETISSPGRVVLDRYQKDSPKITDNMEKYYKGFYQKFVEQGDIGKTSHGSSRCDHQRQSSRGKLDFTNLEKFGDSNDRNLDIANDSDECSELVTSVERTERENDADGKVKKDSSRVQKIENENGRDPEKKASSVDPAANSGYKIPGRKLRKRKKLQWVPAVLSETVCTRNLRPTPVCGLTTEPGGHSAVSDVIGTGPTTFSDVIGTGPTTDALETGPTTVDVLIETGPSTVDVIETGPSTVNDVIETGCTTVDDVIETGCTTVCDVITDAGANSVSDVITETGPRTGGDALETDSKTGCHKESVDNHHISAAASETTPNVSNCRKKKSDKADLNQKTPPRKVDPELSFAEELRLMPLKITRKFFLDVSNGVFDNRSSVVGSGIDATPKPQITNPRRHRHSTVNVTSETRDTVSAQQTTGVQSECKDLQCGQIKRKCLRKQRSVSRDVSADEPVGMSTRNRRHLSTSPYSRMRSGKVPISKTVNSTGNEGKNVGAGRDNRKQELSSECDVPFLRDFKIGSESDASSTWDENCDSYLTWRCQTLLGKGDGEKESCVNKNNVNENKSEGISLRRSAQKRPRKLSGERSPLQRVKRASVSVRESSEKSSRHIEKEAGRSRSQLRLRKGSQEEEGLCSPSDQRLREGLQDNQEAGHSPSQLRLRKGSQDDDCFQKLKMTSGDEISRKRKRKWSISSKKRCSFHKKRKKIPVDGGSHRGRMVRSTEAESSDFE